MRPSLAQRWRQALPDPSQHRASSRTRARSGGSSCWAPCFRGTDLAGSEVAKEATRAIAPRPRSAPGGTVGSATCVATDPRRDPHAAPVPVFLPARFAAGELLSTSPVAGVAGPSKPPCRRGRSHHQDAQQGYGHRENPPARGRVALRASTDRDSAHATSTPDRRSTRPRRSWSLQTRRHWRRVGRNRCWG